MPKLYQQRKLKGFISTMFQHPLGNVTFALKNSWMSITLKVALNLDSLEWKIQVSLIF